MGRTGDRLLSVRWPKWLMASGLLHAATLAVLAIFAGAGDRPPAAMRVRIVSEVRATATPFPVLRPPQTRKAARRPMPVPTESRRLPVTDSPSADRLVAQEPARAEAEAAPVDSQPAAASTTPAGGEIVELGSPPPAGPTGEGRRGGDPPRPGPTDSMDAPLPTSLLLEAKVQGIFLLPGGSGSGTGRGGSGAADRETGTGGGGIGHGGQGDAGDMGGGIGKGGIGGGGIASRGGGGDGMADLLRAIRRQIEQAKIYPDAARRAGMEGTVELRFRIGRDGSF